MPRWPVSLMTKLVAVVLAAIILAAACGGGTEANPEKLIPEGSNLIVKVNVAGLLTSDAVAAVVASLPEDEGDPQSLDQFLDQAISATGIDFRQVSRLVFFADFTPDDDFGALIAKGTFNEAAVLEVLERLQVIATSVYKGWRIHGPEGDTEGVALVFLEGDILVLGSVEAVKAVIDVQEGDRRRVSGAVPDALADLGHGLFSLAVEVPSEEIPDLLSDLGEIPFLGDNGQALSAILGPLQDLEILGLAVAENGQILNLRVNLDFADEDSAASVSKFLEGILTLASGLIPDAEARDLLDSLEVSADGSRLTIRLEVVASQIGSLVRARGEAQPEPPRVSLEAESLQTSIQSLMVDNGLTRVSVPTTATNEFSTLDLDPGPGVAYLSDYLRLPTTDLYFCWDDRGRVFGGQDTPGPCPVRALEPVEAPQLIRPFEETEIMPTKNHVAQGETVVYSTTPPTSGDHWESWAECGFYEDGLPDEFATHNLEHGNIVVSYNLAGQGEIDNLGTALDSIDLFEEWGVARFYDKIPEGTVAVAAWGRRARMPGFELDGLASFFVAYAGKLGPERIAC